MINRYLFTLFFIALAPLLGGSLYGINWSDYKVNVDDTKEPIKENNRTTEFLTTSEGETFSIAYSGELSPSVAKTILRLNGELRSWESMKVSNIDFSVIDPRNIEIAVTPASFLANEIDYTEYVSGGVFFNYSGELYYNFRILVDKIFVNIKGSYIDEKNFVDKLASAVKDPRKYINNRDPEYLLEQIDRLELSLHRVRYALIADIVRKPVDQKLIDEIVELKKNNPSWKVKEIDESLREKEIRISHNIIRAVLQVYFNEY